MLNVDELTPEGRRFLAEIEKLGNLSVKVGFQQGAVVEDGVDLLDIAMWNEFGNARIPARPFMRQSFQKLEEKQGTIARKAINTVLSGGTAETALNQVGTISKAVIQDTIKNGDFVPNSPVTIAIKGSDRPLIDTGHMRQNVRYQITDED